MFDMEWSELALIAVVALIAIGPKELPSVMRTLGQWSRRLRRMAAEFQGHIDRMAHEAELDELRQQAQALNPAHIVRTHMQTPPASPSAASPRAHDIAPPPAATPSEAQAGSSTQTSAGTHARASSEKGTVL